MVARSERLSLEYEVSDRERWILVGVITAAICGIAICASFVHLTIGGRRRLYRSKFQWF
jgi:hypothetical protein